MHTFKERDFRQARATTKLTAMLIMAMLAARAAREEIV